MSYPKVVTEPLTGLDKVYSELRKSIGNCAATTYVCLRRAGQPVWFAKQEMDAQISLYGYEWTFDCTAYRKKRLDPNPNTELPLPMYGRYRWTRHARKHLGLRGGFIGFQA